MKIGIDTHAAEQDGTGNCSYIRGLVSALTALDGDDEYVLYALDPHHRFYAALEPRAKLVVRRLRPRHPVVRIPVVLAAASYRDRIDVLHVQYVGPRHHRGARVVTIHDLAFLRIPESFPRSQRWRLRWQVRANARRAAAIITGSEYSRRDIQAAYAIPPERIWVIHDAPDPRFRPAAAGGAVRERLGIRHPYVLYVGRLNPRKNVLALVRAFERVRPQLGEPAQLVIAGQEDGQADRLDAAIAASPWRANIIRAGYVSDTELPALHAGAAAFVYLSAFEGFGLPPLEAMACGVPVISSDAGALREVLGDAALLVPPGGVEETATALLRVLGEPDLRAALVRKGLQRAAQFSWRTAAEQTREVYRRALEAVSRS